MDSEKIEMSDSGSNVTSGNNTPVGEKIISFSHSPLKKMKANLNKITERSFPKISDEILQIVLLENPLEEECLPSDKENMLPIIQTFIANVCVLERNDEAMNVYVKVFCKMKDKWIGRQGRILMEMMMSELSKFFKEYSSLSEDSIDDRKRNNCFKLCKFVSVLYIEGGIGLRLVLAILQAFYNPNKNTLEVFCKLFSGCRVKIMKDSTFRSSSLFDKYKTFLDTCSKSTSLEPMYKFMCQDILDKM
jgi:hypothetical protein